MDGVRVAHTATLLTDSTVLVAGGVSNSSEASASAELYDPGTGSWTATGNMVEGRASHTATLLRDGKVLVAGSFSFAGEGNAALASAELYDPSSGFWTATGNMIEAGIHHTATLLPDGRVLVAGGSAELYDPSSGSWTATSSMAEARVAHTATLLPDGKVLVAGSFSSNFDPLASAELYDPGSGS